VYVYSPSRRRRLVKEACGRGRARMGAAYQCLPTRETKPIDPGAPSTRALPRLTTTGDQTKNHVILHVESPTRPYQEHRYPVLAMRISLVCLAWCRCPYHSLPKHRSGSTSILLHYYQSLPPGLLNTHTMISSILFYILIVGLLAYASYLKHQIKRK
jgi:hypothetical protein